MDYYMDSADHEHDLRDEATYFRGCLEKMERVMVEGGMDHYSIESPLSRFIKNYISRAGNPIPKLMFYDE